MKIRTQAKLYIVLVRKNNDEEFSFHPERTFEAKHKTDQDINGVLAAEGRLPTGIVCDRFASFASC